MNTYLVTTLDGGSWGFDVLHKTARFNEVKSVTPHDVYVAADLAFAREMGAKDAWNLARKIAEMEPDERKDVFGFPYIKDTICYTQYSEAAEKYKAWKEKSRINVGEVYSDEHGRKALVTFVSRASIDYMAMDGSCGGLLIEVFRKRYPIKTDRHIDISNIIDRLQED